MLNLTTAMASPMREEVTRVAGTGTAKAAGFLAFKLEDIEKSTSWYVTVAILLGVVTLVHVLSSPKLDGREPPVMKPRIPIIGHLIGMIQNRQRYFKVLEYEFHC